MKWDKIEKNPPPKFTAILAYGCHEYFNKKEFCIETVVFDGNEYLVCGEYVFNPTHWMELPDIPTPEYDKYFV